MKQPILLEIFSSSYQKNEFDCLEFVTVTFPGLSKNQNCNWYSGKLGGIGQDYHIPLVRKCFSEDPNVGVMKLLLYAA